MRSFPEMTNSGVLILSVLDPQMDYSFEQKLKRSGSVEGGASLEGADSRSFRSEESPVASLETASPMAQLVTALLCFLPAPV